MVKLDLVVRKISRANNWASRNSLRFIGLAVRGWAAGGRHLADAVGNEVHDIEPRNSLLMKEIDGM